ncbi:MAG: FAD-dependent monooxygenase [Myxococcales bacterium]|nr:FAD-dependent monooxygenase [Myxococcales bacterium]
MLANTTHSDVIIVGAGPTGLAAANEARRHGLSVRIFDRKPNRSTVSKALVVHARTLEAFEAMGVAEQIIAAGVHFETLRVIPGTGAAALPVDLMNLDWGDTRYGYWLSLPQYETERCLEEHLNAQGTEVAWGCGFAGLTTHDDHVAVHIDLCDGDQRTYTARWLVGCDGGRSPVRQAVEIPFDRQETNQTFVIADALGEAPIPENHGTSCMSDEGALFFVPMPEPGRWRVIAHVPDAVAGERIDIDIPFVEALIRSRLGFDFGTQDLSWTSQFTLKQGVARRYRAGRVFIAGDAAHLHSPVGGQGLNTGVQDSFALLWRLALAKRVPTAAPMLLDSYDGERRKVAASMVRNTTRATRLVTLHEGLLGKVRSLVAQRALQLKRVQNQLGRGVGMLDVTYTDTPLGLTEARSKLTVGARMPDLASVDGSLHLQLSARRHTVLLIPRDSSAEHAAELTSALAELRGRGVEAQVWRGAQARRGGKIPPPFGDANIVVVRPDRVVAALGQALDVSLVDRYAEHLLGVPVSAL